MKKDVTTPALIPSTPQIKKIKYTINKLKTNNHDQGFIFKSPLHAHTIV